MQLTVSSEQQIDAAAAETAKISQELTALTAEMAQKKAAHVQLQQQVTLHCSPTVHVLYICMCVLWVCTCLSNDVQVVLCCAVLCCSGEEG